MLILELVCVGPFVTLFVAPDAKFSWEFDVVLEEDRKPFDVVCFDVGETVPLSVGLCFKL